MASHIPNRLHLTDDERILFDYYSNLYLDTQERIDSLSNQLSSIREIIDFITRVDRRPFRHRTNPYRTNYRQRNNLPIFPTHTNAIPASTIPTTGRTSTNIFQFMEDNHLPSREQIQNATRQILFSDVINPINTTCPISLERFEPTTEVMEIIHCRHLFRPSSLQTWFERNSMCPICRYNIQSSRERERDIENNMPPPLQANTTNTDFSFITDQLLQQMMFPLSNESSLNSFTTTTDLSGNSIFFSTFFSPLRH
jgi:hypothetical protein